METTGKIPIRTCRACGLEATTIEELEPFVKDSKSTFGRKNLCNPCQGKLQKLNYDPQRKRNEFVKRQYGLTAEEYDICMSSSHCCEVCGRENDLVYDHDHSLEGIGAFRGVLCRGCNGAIGILGDNLEGLNKAVTYLKRKK